MEQKSKAAMFYEWAQHASLGWQLFSFLFPAAAAVMTGWLARIQDAPWYLVIFYSSGVFMFCVLATGNLMRARWELTLRYKFTCDDFDPLIIATGPNKATIIIRSYFNNLSNMPIEFSLENVFLVLQERSNTSLPDSMPTHSISPNDCVPFSWGAIENIDVRQPILGILKFTAHYGVGGAPQKRTLEEKFVIDIRVDKQKDKFGILNTIGSASRKYS